MSAAGRIDEGGAVGRLFLHDSLEHAAVDKRKRIRPVLRLDGPRGPVERLDDLFGGEALGDGGELGPDGAAGSTDLVA
jgi:hypothetical protein